MNIPGDLIIFRTGFRFDQAPSKRKKQSVIRSDLILLSNHGICAYSTASAALIEAVQTQWTDEKLQESVNIRTTMEERFYIRHFPQTRNTPSRTVNHLDASSGTSCYRNLRSVKRRVG